MISTASTECGGAIHASTPKHREVGTNRQRSGNLWTTTNARIHHYSSLTAALLDDRTTRLDGGLSGVKLATAEVGDSKAVAPQAERAFGVRFTGNTLDNQLARPHITHWLDLFLV